LIITLPLALALRFVEFAHQYSIVKDLNIQHRTASSMLKFATSNLRFHCKLEIPKFCA
jgi:DNA-binding transcriptional regulator LsrR (DeoR family)